MVALGVSTLRLHQRWKRPTDGLWTPEEGPDVLCAGPMGAGAVGPGAWEILQHFVAGLHFCGTSPLPTEIAGGKQNCRCSKDSFLIHGWTDFFQGYYEMMVS